MWRDEALLIFAFFSIYAPISTILYYETGRQANFSLMVIFAIGIVLVLIYLGIKALINLRYRPPMPVLLEEETPPEILQSPPAPANEEFPLPPAHYENVFKENFGSGGAS